MSYDSQNAKRSSGKTSGTASPFVNRVPSSRGLHDGEDDEALPGQTRQSGTPVPVGYGGTTSKRHSDDSAGSSDVVVVPPAPDSPEQRRDSIHRDRDCFDFSTTELEGEQPSCADRLRRFLLNSDPLLFGLLKWGLAALLMLFLAFIVFGMLYSGIRYSENCTSVVNTTPPEFGMPGFCPHAAFGAIIGTFEDTYAYSNCNDDYVSISDSYMNLTVATRDASTGLVTLTSSNFYTGLKWQCVEYARRYWMLNGRPKPAYFGAVDTAADIWNLTEVHLLENTSATLPLHKYKNGDRVVQDGLKAPQKGDIIIYPIVAVGFPAGHVAVITKVELGERGYIYVAEQNWGSRQWASPFHNYSRKIPLRYDLTTSSITLNDPEGKIVGWMRYG